MADRCHCLVPYCRRTTGKLDADDPWICGQHWKLVPRWMKRRRTRLYRLWKKAGGSDTSWPEQPPKARKALRLYWAWWAKIKKTAIERAVGISA